MKGELAITEGLPECGDELAAKNATEHLKGRKNRSVILPSGCDRATVRRQE